MMQSVEENVEESVEKLEKSLADLNGKLATAQNAHSAQTERRKKLIDEINGIASKRAELSVRLARGDAKAAGLIDSLDQKEKSLERERAGVDQIIAETKTEIATLEAEQSRVSQQCGEIRRAERHQMKTDLAWTQVRRVVATLDQARIDVGELCVTLEELDMGGIEGKRVVQGVSEYLWDHAHPSFAENLGWRRPRVLVGLAWRFFVTALLPPGHPSHPGNN